ncbi:hypothetical protein [Nitrososphaera sp. AFS]|uniref:hypothetical protein n=1 Tax=Nitrososphaera sp. AFS TaxID=2301191 RepID=UPI0013922DC3|nr:hypothetical protein [Nitrososphaera sp. AFS]
MTEIITFSISAKLRKKVDELRGDITRSKFVSRIIEDAVQIRTKPNLVPTTGKSLQRPGQPVGSSIQGKPTDA